MFPFVKRIQQSGSKHHRLDEKLTLNQFFEEHYFPHAEASKRQPHHDWSVYKLSKHKPLSRTELVSADCFNRGIQRAKL